MATLVAGNVSTTMTYDVFGNQLSLNDPSAGNTTYTYYGGGELKTQTTPLGTTTNHYQADGKLDYYTNPEGTYNYSYGTNKLLSSITSPGGVSPSYTYYPNGKVHEISETIEAGQTNKVTFVYDRFGRDSIKTYNDSYAESYVYNSNGYLDQILFNGIVIYNVSAMNVRGNITAASIGGTSATWGYNATGQITSSAASGVQGYSYSPNTTTGNMTSRTNSLKSLSEIFYYDNLDRLGSVSGSGGSLNIGYDSISNLIYKSDAGSFFYDNGKPYQLSNVIPPANFPEVPQNIYYTAFGKISTISEGVNSATFKYNSDKQRVKMSFTANGLGVWTKYYFGSSYEKVIESSATTEYIWIGGSPYTAVAVAKIVNGGTPQVWAIFRDHLGTITHLKNGSTIYEYSFDAWGRRRDKDNWSYTLSGEPALFANRGYTGHEHLTEFGLINMNGRLYDPLVGRFLSPDNYVQSPDFTQNFNRYGYCLNNPLRYTDPSGDFIFTLLATLIPGAQPLLPYAIAMDIGWISNVVSNWNEIGSFGEGLAYAGVGAAGGLITTIPGWGYWAGAAFTSGGNQFLNTDICSENVDRSDLTGDDAKKIALATAIGGASSYLGGKIGDKVAGKMITKLNISNKFFKYSLSPTIGGGFSGFMDGFFNEIMVQGDDLKTALAKGGQGAAYGASSLFVFSSIDYGFNKDAINQRMNASSSTYSSVTPYDNYFNPEPRSSFSNVPKTYYNSVSFQTPLNHWNITPNLSIWRVVYPNLYNHMR